MTKLTPEGFAEILPQICDQETTHNPEGWTPNNPLWGHCAVVSLVAQNLFGGDLVRAALNTIPGFEDINSHYWNRLSDDSTHDFTYAQFGNRHLQHPQGEVRQRSYVLSYPETAKRYKLLALRLAKTLTNNNPLFSDQIYQECFYSALDSPCQKMKFGSVITRYGQVVYKGCNDTLKPLRSLCEPTCIRLSIQSRTESMIGACGHAEELGLWKLINEGTPLHECELYVAGLYANCLPWFKQVVEHTCLRCAAQMYLAKIVRIYVPVVDHWEWLTPEIAVETARSYALGEKKVN